jgi:hypothetical protein
MVDIQGVVAGIAGFGPAMGLLYFTLKDYTYPKAEKPFFDDRKAFAFFALGIVLGMVLFAFESWGRTIMSAETLILLVVLYALMECLMKLVILNFPKFQRKVDTAFYGLSLGLGIASTYTFATVYSSFMLLEDPGAFEYVAFTLLGLPLVLVHGSTTTFIAIGVVRADRLPYLSEAILVQLGYNLLMAPFFSLGEPWNYMGLVGATALAVYAYHKIHTLSLPVLIRDAKRIARR